MVSPGLCGMGWWSQQWSVGWRYRGWAGMSSGCLPGRLMRELRKAMPDRTEMPSGLISLAAPGPLSGFAYRSPRASSIGLLMILWSGQSLWITTSTSS